MTATPDERPEPARAESDGGAEVLGRTGDAGVDATLQRLDDSVQSGSLDEQAEAGEAVHRALQDRLADLGGG